MGTSERTDPKMGPFANFSQAYCSGLEMWVKTSEPMLKGIGRWNVEVMGLVTRRTQAWVDFPSRVSQCKTPQELMREQIQFWQSAMQDYAEGTQRLTLALGTLAGSTVAGLRDSTDAALSRDYISFPEGSTLGQDGQRDRRAA